MKPYFYDDLKTVMSRILIFSVLGLILISILISSLQNNYFKFDHPEDAWVSDCLIFFDKPDLVRKNNKNLAALFGYEGENGIASEFAAKHDQPLNKMYNYVYGDPKNNCAYIVYLMYGTDCRDEIPETYFRLSYMDGNGVLHDENDGMIEVGEAEAYGDIEASLDMTKAPGERLSVAFTKETVYGAIVIPVTLHCPDQTGVSVFVNMSVYTEREMTAVDSDEKFILDKNAEAEASVELSSVSIGYLTKSDYNYGHYAESAITATPATFENGVPQYMVIDFQFKSLVNGDTDKRIETKMILSDKNAMTMKIQEAPTSNIRETADGSRVELVASYTIPKKQGEAKTVRMILKLMPHLECDVDMDIVISVGGGNALFGEIYKATTFHIVSND